jgi:hypothetical protein
VIACPSCGAESPDGARFCAFCATPLAAGTPAREERKVVSVVFVDLAGHTARSDSADPEGAVSDAAYTRLQLARTLDDPEPWLSDADAFYRGVGATRYLVQLDELRATRRSA